MIRLLLLLISTLLVQTVFAQDPAFTQFYAAPTYLNPALAGSAHTTRLTTVYRNQWPGLEAKYTTQFAAIDHSFNELQLGMGVQAMFDQSGNGTISTSQISVPLSYELNVSRSMSMRFGLQAGYHSIGVDWGKHKFGDQIDPRYGFIYETQQQFGALRRSKIDLGAGMMVYGDKTYGGIAIHHLNASSSSKIQGPEDWFQRRYTVHAGRRFELSKSYQNVHAISFESVVQRQNRVNYVSLGAYWNYGILTLGTWVRPKRAVVFLAGLKWDQFQVAYSAEMPLGGLGLATLGGHEVSINYTLPVKKRVRRHRPLRCPSF